MINKLLVSIYHAILLSILTAFTGSFVLAMGLGDIHVFSKLNQPLNIEIEVIEAGSIPVDEIMVSNARRETYRKAQLDSPELLNKVRFKVIKKSDGKVVAKITTKKPVKEPFITFIADLRWREGHINREYTFLLDPPNFVKKQTQIRYKSENTRKKPLVNHTNRSVGINQLATQKDYSRVLTNHKSERRYTTRRSDTLWNIAKKFRPDEGVTTWQTMQAIFVLNQDAFINGDINLLKQRQTLSLPNSDEVRQINGKPLKKIAQKNHTTQKLRSESDALQNQKSPSRVVEPKPVKKSANEKPAIEKPAEAQAHLKIIPPPETLINKPVTSKKDLLLINKALKTSMDTIKLLQTENEILMAQVDTLTRKVNNLDSHNAELNDKITEITRLLKDMRTAEALKKASHSDTTDKPESSTHSAPERPQALPKEVKVSSLSTSITSNTNKNDNGPVSVESTATHNKPAQRSFLQELLTNPIISLALAVFIIVIMIGTYITLKKQKVRYANNPSGYETDSDDDTVLSQYSQAESNSRPAANDLQRPVNRSSGFNTSITQTTHSTNVEKDEDEMDFFEYFEKKINAPDEPGNQAGNNNVSENIQDNLTDSDTDMEFSLDLSDKDIEDFEQSFDTTPSETQDDKTLSVTDILSEVDTYIAYGNYNVAEDILTSAITNTPLSKELNLKLFDCYALANKRYEFIQHVKQIINLLNEHMVMRHRVENIYQQTWNEPLDITQLD